MLKLMLIVIATICIFQNSKAEARQEMQQNNFVLLSNFIFDLDCQVPPLFSAALLDKLCGKLQFLFTYEVLGRTHFFARGKYFYVISKERTAADNAQSVCVKSKGNLAEVLDSDTQRRISNTANILLPSDSRTVQIYASPSQQDVFKYTVTGLRVQNDPFSFVLDWRRPRETGRLRRFRLYRNPSNSNNFTREINFCFVANRDNVQYDDCNDGWRPNFVLYGGINQTNETITLYNYYNNRDGQFSTNLFLRDDIGQHASHLTLRNNPIIIPDISLFTGARSDVGQLLWSWYNGTKINNTLYPLSDPSVCEQMSWPLTYDDGINLRAKPCEEESHFVCEIQFQINVSPLTCQGDMLRVSWNRLDLSKTITNDSLEFRVQIRINGNETETTWNTSKNFEWFLSGLKSRTTYMVEAETKIGLRFVREFGAVASASATTFYGIPEPVKNARVVNDATTSACVIEWENFGYNVKEAIGYKIFGLVGNDTISQIEVNSSSLSNFMKPNNTERYAIDLASYPINALVEFQIQAFTCEGAGDVKNVTGNCIVPKHLANDQSINQNSESSQPLNLKIIVIPVVLIVIILLVALGLFWYKKKKSKGTSVNKNLTGFRPQKAKKSNEYKNAKISDQALTRDFYQNSNVFQQYPEDDSQYLNSNVPPQTGIEPYYTCKIPKQQSEEVHYYVIPNPVVKKSKDKLYVNESKPKFVINLDYANEVNKKDSNTPEYVNNTNDVNAESTENFYEKV